MDSYCKRGAYALLILVFLTSCTQVHHAFESPLARDVYLPLIAALGCPQTAEAGNLAHLLTTDERQEHPSLTCHPALVDAARARAANLSRTGFISHCDTDGRCANWYAARSGCVLPPEYTANGKEVESFILGPNDATIAYQILALSPGHAAHLFGRNAFFRSQTHYGIAAIRVPGSLYEYHYVFYIARCL